MHRSGYMRVLRRPFIMLPASVNTVGMQAPTEWVNKGTVRCLYDRPAHQRHLELYSVSATVDGSPVVISLAVIFRSYKVFLSFGVSITGRADRSSSAFHHALCVLVARVRRSSYCLLIRAFIRYKGIPAISSF